MYFDVGDACRGSRRVGNVEYGAARFVALGGESIGGIADLRGVAAVRTISAPCRASPSASAQPMPWLEPVINARVPVKSNSDSLKMASSTSIRSRAIHSPNPS